MGKLFSVLTWCKVYRRVDHLPYNQLGSASDELPPWNSINFVFHSAILLNSYCYLPSETLRYSLHTGSIVGPLYSTRRCCILACHAAQYRILKYIMNFKILGIQQFVFWSPAGSYIWYINIGLYFSHGKVERKVLTHVRNLTRSFAHVAWFLIQKHEELA